MGRRLFILRTWQYRVGYTYQYMLFNTLIHQYLLWHYSTALREIWHVYKNFVWFITHLFSLPQLIKSLFAPWKRMTEEREGGFNLEAIAGYIIINLLSRVIGTLIRLTIIIAGLTALILITLSLLSFYILWLSAPAAIPVLILYGSVLLLI